MVKSKLTNYNIAGHDKVLMISKYDAVEKMLLLPLKNTHVMRLLQASYYDITAWTRNDSR